MAQVQQLQLADMHSQPPDHFRAENGLQISEMEIPMHFLRLHPPLESSLMVLMIHFKIKWHLLK